MSKSNYWTRAFTLVELLVVIALIAGLSAFWVGGFHTNQTADLQSAQTSLANLLMTARANAFTSGKRTRIVVHAEMGSNQPADRFLRFVVLQQRVSVSPEKWIALRTLEMPKGVYVVPVDLSAFAGLHENSATNSESDWRWQNGSKTELGSTLFYGDSVAVDLGDGMPSANFQGVMFTERGTIARLDGKGAFPMTLDRLEIIVAAGRPKVPGTFDANGAPVFLDNANAVRAIQVSVYGVPLFINERESL